ncbi:methyltransferase domain-containing protein [Nonomuraea longicatena]|uniref:Protein-L-isoaspartate O-methyltransferase n=1 Tax=Nonomuraea longicatena TaxID=83682 RepID=A0ABN1QV97_9ACTN
MTTDPTGRMLAAITERRGRPVPPKIEQAFRAVPRQSFVPPQGLISGTGGERILIDRDTHPDEWLEAVASNDFIVTQVADGAASLRDGKGTFSSSNSAPSTVTTLLDLLDPEAGHRVLEIGTGTGWTAALLSHLVGAGGGVISIEVDPHVAEQAAKNLADAPVRLVVADGADGWPDGAPYDRVHVTCAVRSIPYAWIQQARPGAVIVAPYSTGQGDDQVVRLVVMPDGSAHGRFPARTSYMLMRGHRTVYPPKPDNAPLHSRTTRVDPRMIAEAPQGALLAMASATGLHFDTQPRPDHVIVWALDPDDPGQRARAVWTPGTDEYPVVQVGDRPVWDEAVAAYFQWVGWGEPGRDRFGMTVTADRQEIWLDSPERVISPP